MIWLGVAARNVILLEDAESGGLKAHLADFGLSRVKPQQHNVTKDNTVPRSVAPEAVLNSGVAYSVESEVVGGRHMLQLRTRGRISHNASLR